MKLENTWLSTNLPNFLAIFQLLGGEKEICLLSGRFVAQFFLGHGRRRRKVKTGARRLPPPLRHTEAPPSPAAKVDRATAADRVFFFHFGISFVWKFVDRIDELSICPNDELIKMIFKFLKNWKKIEKKSQIFFNFFGEFFVCFPILKNNALRNGAKRWTFIPSSLVSYSVQDDKHFLFLLWADYFYSWFTTGSVWLFISCY